MSSDAPPSATPPAEQAGAPKSSPYRNLWGPLVIVPALIVMVPVLIVALFGGIGGGRKPVESYLVEIESGGANERKQALFELTRLVLEWVSTEDEAAREELGLDVELLLPRLELAWERAQEDDPEVRFVLAAMFALLDHDQGVPRLSEVLALDESDDPDAALRYQALFVLGSIGDPGALSGILPLLDAEDPTLRAYAVIAMQKMPLERVREPLHGALEDDDLLVRGNAAIALSRLGDPAGATVLLGLLERETYAAEHELNPRRYASEGLVGETRLAALEALGALRRPQDRALVEELARDEGDLNLRSLALRLERDWELPAESRN